MSKTRRDQRQAIALQAAIRLGDGEQAIDAALHEIGRLCADLPKMRQEAQLSALVGQDIFASLGRAYTLLTEARGALVDGHVQLDRVRGELRLAPVVATSGTDKPPNRAAPVIAIDRAA